MAQQQKFQKKWLEGLTFRSSEPKVVEKDGRKMKTYVAVEREMTEADVLSWKDYGQHVVIVTADGQKVTVEK